MPHDPPLVQILSCADAPTLELVRFAIAIATGSEEGVRAGAQRVALSSVPLEWVEELVLQSYLFVGFPRALNAAREWRRAAAVPAPTADEGEDLARVPAWWTRGEITCEIVYGRMYEKLRQNVRELHPALDTWMIVEGYGKVLGRHGLDLARRELCIVATCAVTGQERQLHSHFHGARHAGASDEAIDAVLAVCGEHLDAAEFDRVQRLWGRVRGSP